MKLTTILKGLCMMMFMALALPEADAQTKGTVSGYGTTTSVSGSAPLWTTSKWDTLVNAAWSVDSFTITEYNRSIIFQLQRDTYSGSGGGYFHILGSTSKSTPFSPITSINMVPGDSTYSYIFPVGYNYSYVKTIIQDTGTQSTRYKTNIQLKD